LNNNYFKKIFIVLILFFPLLVYSQVELVAPSHPVYSYLKRMQLIDVIKEYNSANLPLSREKIAGYLKVIDSLKPNISNTDRKILDDYKIEFEYDMYRDTKNSIHLFKKSAEFPLFQNKKQKYLYFWSDSNATYFFDGLGMLSQRMSTGDSLGKHSITLGELGLRMRGTLFNSLGYYIRVSNGQRLGGTMRDVNFAYTTDPKLKANNKFSTEGKNFDSYEGYLRFRTNSEWLSITAGKEAMLNGFGYVDKMFISNNTAPFPFLKIDLKYKALGYTFFYGSLKGDSLGVDMQWKSIASHRFDVQPVDFLRFGIFESIIISSTPFSFDYLNPISFLISSDLNTGSSTSYKNNTVAGIDMEILPVRKLAVQATLLIDDLNFSTITKDDNTSNDNKFGWQVGAIWTDAFTIPDFTACVEYTRLNPFIYSHRSNKNTYSNWGMSLGHALPPNSDEIAAKLTYNLTNRIKFELLYQHQRSGEGIVFDSLGNVIINYGGNVNRGDGDFLQKNTFLQGNRINRDILTLNLLFEPIKQYYFEIKLFYRLTDLKYIGKKQKDYYAWLTFRLDY